MSCSRSSFMSSLRIPCPEVVLVSEAIPARVLSANVEAATQIEQIERPPKRVWDRIIAEPDRAPEYIALAAAERFGPQAAEWVRIAGPGQTPEKLARIAFKKHVRLARLEGGALGIGGAITAAPDLVALLWIQSRMVFYIAAAYGYDPRHPMRPAEYLAKRMARRYAGRLIPFIGAPIGAMQNGNAMRQLGERALRYYARP